MRFILVPYNFSFFFFQIEFNYISSQRGTRIRLIRTLLVCACVGHAFAIIAVHQNWLPSDEVLPVFIARSPTVGHTEEIEYQSVFQSVREHSRSKSTANTRVAIECSGTFDRPDGNKTIFKNVTAYHPKSTIIF